MATTKQNPVREFFSEWQLAESAAPLHQAAERLVREHLESLVRKLRVTLEWDGNKLVANLFDGEMEFIHTLKIEKSASDTMPETFGYVPKPPEE